MTLFITGGGLVGSQVAGLAVEQGIRPVVYDLNPQRESIGRIVSLDKIDFLQGNVLDYNQFERDLKESNADRIVHTAANPLLTVGAQENPYSAIQLNIMGTVNALELSRKLKIKRFVFPSSSVLYTNSRPGTEIGKLSEDNYPRPTTVYASTKLTCENLGLNYSESFGVDFVALRFRAVIGPWSGTGGGGGPSNMLRQAIEKSFKGEAATLSSRRYEFVYSKDCARAVMCALDENRKFSTQRIFNVGMGKVYSPEEIATLIKERVPRAKIEVEKKASTLPTEPPIDLSRSATVLGYTPMYDMPKALEDYITWYKNQGIL